MRGDRFRPAPPASLPSRPRGASLPASVLAAPPFLLCSKACGVSPGCSLSRARASLPFSPPTPAGDLGRPCGFPCFCLGLGCGAGRGGAPPGPSCWPGAFCSGGRLRAGLRARFPARVPALVYRGDYEQSGSPLSAASGGDAQFVNIMGRKYIRRGTQTASRVKRTPRFVFNAFTSRSGEEGAGRRAKQAEEGRPGSQRILILRRGPN